METVIRIGWRDGRRFEAANEEGATTVLDSAPAGEGAGLSPMQHLLAALGGCTAMDVIGILRKKRLDVRDYRLEVTGVRASQHPKVFTDISVKHIVTGHDIPADAVRHAVELSEEKYCSVSAMLRQAANISVDYEVRSPATVAP